MTAPATKGATPNVRGIDYAIERPNGILCPSGAPGWQLTVTVRGLNGRLTGRTIILPSYDGAAVLRDVWVDEVAYIDGGTYSLEMWEAGMVPIARVVAREMRAAKITEKVRP